MNTQRRGFPSFLVVLLAAVAIVVVAALTTWWVLLALIPLTMMLGLRIDDEGGADAVRAGGKSRLLRGKQHARGGRTRLALRGRTAAQRVAGHAVGAVRETRWVQTFWPVTA